MLHRLFTIILLGVILLVSANTLHSGESAVDQVSNPAAKVLNDYYKEFDQTIVSDENCQCNLETKQKKESLGNYYSELLK